jgi:hypothetical protein
MDTDDLINRVFVGSLVILFVLVLAEYLLRSM